MDLTVNVTVIYRLVLLATIRFIRILKEMCAYA